MKKIKITKRKEKNKKEVNLMRNKNKNNLKRLKWSTDPELNNTNTKLFNQFYAKL